MLCVVVTHISFHSSYICGFKHFRYNLMTLHILGQVHMYGINICFKTHKFWKLVKFHLNPLFQYIFTHEVWKVKIIFQRNNFLYVVHSQSFFGSQNIYQWLTCLKNVASILTLRWMLLRSFKASLCKIHNIFFLEFHVFSVFR